MAIAVTNWAALYSRRHHVDDWPMMERHVLQRRYRRALLLSVFFVVVNVRLGGGGCLFVFFQSCLCFDFFRLRLWHFSPLHRPALFRTLNSMIKSKSFSRRDNFTSLTTAGRIAQRTVVGCSRSTRIRGTFWGYTVENGCECTTRWSHQIRALSFLYYNLFWNSKKKKKLSKTT